MSLSMSSPSKSSQARRGLVLAAFLLAPLGHAVAAPTGPSGQPQELLDLPIPTGPLMVQCLLGSSVTTYNPGLTDTPQNVTRNINSTYTLCANLLGTPLFLTAGSGTGNVPVANASCQQAIEPPEPIQESFFWGDGGFTTVLFTQIGLRAKGTASEAVLIGTVTSGRFPNAVAMKTVTYVNGDPTNGCGQPGGLRELRGPSTLSFYLPTN
ncbi:hypothetical protein [Corallococcus carmarthensis]|uniref:Secreted protein n=1 Tax=Corallococcus carmarthensis TaxID=2316728 RepID=A0A3A8KNE3_9BACT|nr:hypothetical protein [Corallococcus carmarthensis]RKH05685.1 hypothetical protein D7X32_07160 [Corallococcus carmarthensis]